MENPLTQNAWPLEKAMSISFAEAISIIAVKSSEILSQRKIASATCGLDGALGRVLAQAVIADRDQPPFARVTRDGFALRAEDLTGGTPLRVVGELRAGEAWAPNRPSLLAGEAVEIMTGAALPPGADAVLMVEHAELLAGTRSILSRAGRTLAAGENIVSRGSEAKQGDILLPPGTRMRPEEIALAASCGLRSLSVFQVPKVAILATGDELVEPEAPNALLEPHQIYDSNSHALAALVHHNNGIPLRQRAVQDRREDLTVCIQESLKAAPLLLLTGGVSMGRYDLVEEVLTSLGAEFFFTGVKMQPGKPVVFGRIPAAENRPTRYFFGLPGNPVSTMVTFRAFVQPLLAALSGERNWQPRIACAMLSSEVHGKPGLTRFLPGHLNALLPQPTVTPIRNQGSGDVAANSRANCYVIVPEDCESIRAGQAVRVLLHGL